MMTPILQDLKRSVKDRITVLKVDVDKNQELARQYRIQGVPTLILFQKGSVRWRQSGIIPAQKLVRIIDTYTKVVVAEY